MVFPVTYRNLPLKVAGSFTIVDVEVIVPLGRQIMFLQSQKETVPIRSWRMYHPSYARFLWPISISSGHFSVTYQPHLRSAGYPTLQQPVQWLGDIAWRFLVSILPNGSGRTVRQFTSYTQIFVVFCPCYILQHSRPTFTHCNLSASNAAILSKQRRKDSPPVPRFELGRSILCTDSRRVGHLPFKMKT